VTSVPFFLVFFTFVTAFSMWRGGGPERIVSVSYIVALAGSATVGIVHMPGGFRAVPIQVFVVDVLLLVALSVIAIRANRWWPIVAAGCQLIAVLVHVVKLMQPTMIPNGYAFLVTIWSWPMVALLGLGTRAHRRRLAQAIIVPDWKPSSMGRQSPTLAPQQAS
jgi:hypothetical protein